MASTKTINRQNSKNNIEMHRTYNAAEWLLREKVEPLDYLMFKLYQEARTLGVDGKYIQDYMREKLLLMINEVASKREEEERQGVRGRKKIY